MTVVSFSHVAEVSDASDLTTYTFSGASLGAVHAERRIYLAIHWGDTATIADLSTVTIGGVSSTIHAQINDSSNETLAAAIVSAAVPSGTTGDIVVTFAAGVTRCAVDIYRAVGADATPLDVDSTDADMSESPSLTLNTETGGVLLAACTCNSDTPSPSISWTGITEVYDASLELQAFIYSGGFDDSLSNGTQAVTPTYTIVTNNASALVAVSIMSTRQRLRPSTDEALDGWTDEAGGSTNIFQSIDEAAPANDADYIKSPTDPAAAVYRSKFSPPASATAEPFKINHRYWKTGTAGMDITFRLVQGASTVISSVTHTDVSTTPQTSVLELTALEYADITDFDDLYIEIQADQSLGSFLLLDDGASHLLLDNGTDALLLDA